MSGYLPFLGCGDGGAAELGVSRLRGGGPAEELPHPGYDGLPALGQPRHLRRASPLPLRLRLLLDDGKDSAAWLVNNSSRTTSMPHTESKAKLEAILLLAVLVLDQDTSSVLAIYTHGSYQPMDVQPMMPAWRDLARTADAGTEHSL